MVHHIYHHSKKEFICSLCQKSFGTNASLQKHRIVHNEESKYDSFQSDKQVIKQFVDPKTHHISHTGEKHFKCSLCQKSFSLSVQLNKHMVVHTGAKEYYCSYCDMAFLRNGDLKRHKVTHNKNRDFNCSYCGKLFTQSHHLKRHIVTHTGVRGYECLQCYKSCKCPTLSAF